MRLPPEIINSIFESLVTDAHGPDIDALKACNLTSSTFSQICEPFLYSSVYIYLKGPNVCKRPDPYYPQCMITVDRLSKTLAAKPYISQHVKRLGLISLTEKYWRFSGQDLEDWFLKVENVVNQLPLHQLEWFKFYTGRWNEFPNHGIGRDIVLRIISSPALKTLQLYGLERFPLCDFVSPRHNIRHLDIGMLSLLETPTDGWDNKTFNLDSLVIRISGDRPPKLLKLETHDGMDVFNVASMSSLRILDNRLRPMYLRTLLERCHKLEELEIAYTYNEELQAEELINRIWGTLVPVQKTLRTLEFMLDRWPGSSHITCRDDLSNLFRLPPEMCFTSLAYIHLQLKTWDPHKLPDRKCNEDTFNLAGLADYIRNQNAFKNLKEVRISFKDEKVLIGYPNFSGNLNASVWVLTGHGRPGS